MCWWTQKPIVPLLAERLWHSAWLFGWAVLVTLPLSLALALASVVRPHSLFDRASSFFALSIMSVPEFVVAYAVMFILAVQVDWFPAYTMYALNLPWTERLYATTLPILSLIAVTVTPTFRLTRAALPNVLKRIHPAGRDQGDRTAADPDTSCTAQRSWPDRNSRGARHGQSVFRAGDCQDCLLLPRPG